MKTVKNIRIMKTKFNNATDGSRNKSSQDISIKRRISTTHEFIQESKKVHGETYDYYLVKYEGTNKKVIIKCQIHGIFKQSPNNHLNGAGCPYCAYNKLTRPQFLEKMDKIHDNVLDFTNCEYTQHLCQADRITVKCKIHGNFSKRISQLLKGYGCPKCKKESNKRLINSIMVTEKIKNNGNSELLNDNISLMVKYKRKGSDAIDHISGSQFKSETDAAKSLEEIKMFLDMIDAELVDEQILIPLKDHKVKVFQINNNGSGSKYMAG